MFNHVNKKLMPVLVLMGLVACNRDQLDSVVKRDEIEALGIMVHEVSAQLVDLGFPLDPDRVSIDVKSPMEMALMYNQISDESRQDVKTYTPFGPLFLDGAEQRWAFYDPNTKTIVFQKGANKEMSQGYLAHELIHVYQDQKWGFDRIWQAYQANPSREMFNISQYIIEGHAELARQAYEQAHAKDPVSISKLTLSLGKMVDGECVICSGDKSIPNLPYYMGMRFLANRYQDGGWTSVEDKLVHLPSSSEQILHPDKLNSDLPSEVELPIWQDDDFPAEMVFNGTMGEAFLLNKMMSITKPAEAYNNASGWDGDRSQLYRMIDGREVLIWRIVFDREIDAIQLESTLKEANMARDNMRVAKTIDWVISDSVELKNKLRIFMSKNPFVTADEESDEDSTAKQENLGANDTSMFYPKSRPRLSIGPNNTTNP